DLFFITGADAMLEIVQWKDSEETLSLAHFIAATRPGYDLSALERGPLPEHPNVTVMTIPALTISSSDIRERVAKGRPIRYLVPEGVQTYIEKAGLYRPSPKVTEEGGLGTKDRLNSSDGDVDVTATR